jgi:hypothetical protein
MKKSSKNMYDEYAHILRRDSITRYRFPFQKIQKPLIIPSPEELAKQPAFKLKFNPAKLPKLSKTV